MQAGSLKYKETYIGFEFASKMKYIAGLHSAMRLRKFASQKNRYAQILSTLSPINSER